MRGKMIPPADVVDSAVHFTHSRQPFNNLIGRGLSITREQFWGEL
jgi:hypothetical protein